MKEQELSRRAAALKRHEVFSFQAAYYLLQDEELAREAATNALAELLRDDTFYHHAAELQKQTVKQMCMKHSLRAKAKSLQPVLC